MNTNEKRSAAILKAKTEDAEREGVTHVALTVETAREVLDYIAKLKGRNCGDARGISVGDAVSLYVYEEEESDQAETGTVLGFTPGGYLIKPDTGDYKDTTTGLWYATEHVTKVEGE